MIRDSAARQLSLTLPLMARLDLTDDERAELARLLRQVIDGDRFPLSPRIRRLRQILAKLEPLAPAAEPFPAPKAARRAQPRAAQAPALISSYSAKAATSSGARESTTTMTMMA